jgi:hypothetical protein
MSDSHQDLWLSLRRALAVEGVDPFEVANKLLESFEEALRPISDGNDMQVYNEACFWLEQTEVRTLLWNWIVNVARTLQTDRRRTLVIAIFEVLIEAPKDDFWIAKVLSLWKEGDTQWIVPMAYENHQNELWEDMNRLAGKFNEVRNHQSDNP